MEDIEGVPLKSVIPETGFDVPDFLQLATKIGNIFI